MKNKLQSVYVYLHRKINQGHHRSVKAKKNIVTAFVFKGSSIVLSLFLVPLTIHYVNPTQYGIWLTLSAIIGWFGYFDIGFGHGLRNKLTESISRRKYKLSRIYISTTYALFTIIASVILLVFLVVNPFINWTGIINTRKEMATELSILALIVLVFFCLQFVFQLIITVLTANQQPGYASLFNFLSNTLSLTIIFVLTKMTSGNLILLGLVFGLVPLFVLMISSIWFYTHDYKDFAPSVKLVRFSFIGNIFSLGFKFFLLQIAGLVLYESSNIIITQLFGPAQVTTYNIAFKYFSVIPMVFAIVNLPFWSAFTKAWVEKDIQWIRSAIRKLQVFWLIFLGVAALMLAFSGYAYKLWIGTILTVPVSLSATMAAFVVISTWNAIFSQFLNGVGIVRLQLYSSIIGALINIPLAILLGKKLGIAGVILSSVLLTSVNMVWGYIQYKKIINFKASGIWAA